MIQEQKINSPIWVYQCYAIFLLSIPIGIFWILFKIGLENQISIIEILKILYQSNAEFFIYLCPFLFIPWMLWNIRLTITPSKIHYSLFSLQISPSIKNLAISSSQINLEYDSPFTQIYRKFKKIKHKEDQFKFDQRYGTVEFIPLQPKNYHGSFINFL